MMTDYVKRIQSNLSGKKIKLSRPAIRQELELLDLTPETLTKELAELVIDKLVSKFSSDSVIQENEPSEKSDLISQDVGTDISTNPEIDSITDSLVEAPTESNYIEKLETSSQTVSETEQELILDKCEAEKEIILDKLPEPSQEPEAGIVVSESEKHDLITTQSSILDVQLSELETVELCSQIPDVFDDYKSFVDSVTSAIKAFVDDRFDHQETSTVDDSISELRQHIAHRQARLDSRFAQGLNDVKEDLEQIRSNIKSRQFAILERFRTRAKT